MTFLLTHDLVLALYGRDLGLNVCPWKKIPTENP